MTRALTTSTELNLDEMDTVRVDDGEVGVGGNRLQAGLMRTVTELYDLAEPLEGGATKAFLIRVPFLLTR